MENNFIKARSSWVSCITILVELVIYTKAQSRNIDRSGHGSTCSCTCRDQRQTSQLLYKRPTHIQTAPPHTEKPRPYHYFRTPICFHHPGAGREIYESRYVDVLIEVVVSMKVLKTFTYHSAQNLGHIQIVRTEIPDYFRYK